jgi:hypothetical protein
MPKPDYTFQASIVIACEGPLDGEIRTGPAGFRRSRDGAMLHHVLSDAQYWAEEFRNTDSLQHHVTLLENPTRADVVAAIAEAGDFLHHYKRDPGWNGGQINFAFAGHGVDGGELVLADAKLSPDEIAETIAECTWTREQTSLRLAVVLDSCFSGRTLAKLLLHRFHGTHYLLIDGFAAALHDELAWELEALSHGALTFTMRNRGNAHVDQNRLARAVQEQDEDYLRFALQAYVPNPVTYLTEGDQHSIDLINGHEMEIKGCGTVDVIGEVTLDQLLEKVEQTRAHPDLFRTIEL